MSSLKSGQHTVTRSPSCINAAATLSTEVFDDEDVPASLGSIRPILRVASEIEHERPRAAFLCRFYAFAKSHRLDALSIGRDVRRFKTSLLQKLARLLTLHIINSSAKLRLFRWRAMTTRTINWLLAPFNDDYQNCRISDPREYYCGLRREWPYRFAESELLANDLRSLGVQLVHRRSLNMPRRNVRDYEMAVKRIRNENNKMLLRRTRYYMLKLAKEHAIANGRELSSVYEQRILSIRRYQSDEEISDEE